MSRFYSNPTQQTVAAEDTFRHLRELYDTYIRESTELYESQEVSVSETFKRYFCLDDYRNAPIHKKFYLDTEKCARQLAEQLVACPSAALSREAVTLLLGDKSGYGESSQHSWLIAAEGVAIELVPHLSAQDARDIAAAYGQQYQWRDMMPRQRELYNALCRAGGEKARKSSWFAGLISSGPVKNSK